MKVRACFDRLSTNGCFRDPASQNPFVLSLSKDARQHRAEAQ